MNKNELRKQFLQIRNSEPVQSREQKNRLIQNRLFTSAYYKDAEKIFIYVSFGSEADTMGIICRCFVEGKTVAVPTTKKNGEMDFVEIENLEMLAATPFGVMEPRNGGIILPDSRTLAIVPGLVFSYDKYRIGYGKGFYDRYLTGKEFLSKIGLAYSFQIVNDKDNTMNEPHDVQLDWIITEEAML